MTVAICWIWFTSRDDNAAVWQAPAARRAREHGGTPPAAGNLDWDWGAWAPEPDRRGPGPTHPDPPDCAVPGRSACLPANPAQRRPAGRRNATPAGRTPV